MKFFIDNVYLFAIALVSGGLLLWPLIRRGGGSASLSPMLATRLINHRNAIVVDVRDEKDFAAGSLAGARNLPFAVLKDRASELIRFKSRPVLVVCGSGQDSSRAVAVFVAEGFAEAHALAGGVAAWKQAGLPLVQPGRDNTKAPPRDAGRKGRADQRGRASRGGQRPTADANDAAVVAPVEAGVPAAPSEELVATEASRPRAA